MFSPGGLSALPVFLSVLFPYIFPESADTVQAGRHARHHKIQYGERSHTFYYYNGSGDDDGVVASADGDRDIFSGAGNGLLFCADGSGGFERRAEDHITAVADAAQYASCVVGQFADPAVCFRVEGVVVDGAVGAGGGETVADLEAFYGSDGTDSFRQIFV